MNGLHHKKYKNCYEDRFQDGWVAVRGDVLAKRQCDKHKRGRLCRPLLLDFGLISDGNLESVIVEASYRFIQGIRIIRAHAGIGEVESAIFAVAEGMAGQNVHLMLAAGMQEISHGGNVFFSVINARHKGDANARLTAGVENMIQIV